MFAKLYNSDETIFNSLGLGILKDAKLGKVVHERNGQYDLELEYPVDSRLAKYLIKYNIIKADAGKRFKGQLFRIFKTIKTLEGTIKVYAYHITNDLSDNLVPLVDIKGSSCINALNAIKTNAALDMPFEFNTDITHIADFKIERINALNALGGVEGSIIDTFGNGANIIRNNFNISIMQNYGNDNNVLIAYKKNMTELNVDDEGDIVTGIYPYYISQDGIDSSGSTVSETIDLPEKYLYREDYENFKKQKVVPVDFSDDKNVNSIDKLREKASKYFNNVIDDNINIKVNFLDETSLSDIENVSQLKLLDVYDSVIVRYLDLNINYKSKINKVIYDFIKEEYEQIEIGEKRTNLATDTVSREEEFKKEIDKTNNFWQQAIEHATNQITGNSGGYVKMWPPDKPSEIFVMDNDNANLATNVLRINKQGIGFSKNGINGPFETAWTADGTFYANFITAGILNANLIRVGTISDYNNNIAINLDEGNIKVVSKDTNTHTTIDASSFRVEDDKGGTVAEFSANSYIPQLVSNTIEAKEIYSPNILNLQKSTTIYVDLSNGKDTNEGTETSKFKTIQKALDSLNKYFEDDESIIIDIVGSGNQEVRVKGFCGSGYLMFNLSSSAKLHCNTFDIRECTTRIIIDGAKDTTQTTTTSAQMINSDSGHMIYARQSSFVEVRNICLVGDNTGYAVGSVYGSSVLVRNCEISKFESCVRAGYNGYVYIHACYGSDVKYITDGELGGIVHVQNTASAIVPNYTENIYDTEGSSGYARLGLQSGGTKTDGAIYKPSTTTPPPPTTSTNTRTWSFDKIWSDETLNNWSNRNELIQGYYSGWSTGRWTGYMQMTDDFAGIRSTINSATNLSGRIYIQRSSSSGNSTGSKLCLYGSDGTVVTTTQTIDRSQGVWVSLSSAIVTKIQSGAIKYFYLKADSSNAATYFKCESNAKIEITYTK